MATKKIIDISVNGTDEIKKLNNEINNAANSLGELKKQKQLLEEAFENADFGSQEFNKLQSQLREVNTRLKIIDESVSDLTIAEKIEGVNKVVGGLAAGFSFAAVSVQAFGEENSKTAEELQKLELQVTAIIQGTQAFQALTEAFSSKNKIFLATLNSLSLGFNRLRVATQAWSVGTKAAIAATGIGLVVTAVGLLVENFDKLAKVGSSLLSSFQPFFYAVRDIANVFSFGLVDNSSIAKIKSTNEELTKSITKRQEESKKNIDKINLDLELGLITTVKKQELSYNNLLTDLQKQAKETGDVLQKTLSDDLLTDLQKAIDQTKDNNIFGFNNSDLKKLEDAKIKLNEIFTIRKQIQNDLNNNSVDEQTIKNVQKIKDILSTINTSNGFGVNILPLSSGLKALINDTSVLDITVKNLTNTQTKNNEVQKASVDITKAKIDEQNKLINSTLKIQQLENQRQSDSNKINQNNNDLLKQGIDLILKYGQAINDPKFKKGFNVFDDFDVQLQNIKNNLPAKFSDLFDNIRTLNGENLIDQEKLIKIIEVYGDKQADVLQKNSELQKKNINDQIEANKKLAAIQTDPAARKEYTALNNVLENQKKLIDSDLTKSYTDLKNTVEQLKASVPDLAEKLSLNKLQDNFDENQRAFEDYKNGLTKSFGSINKAYVDLSQAEQDALGQEQSQKSLDFFKTQQEGIINLSQTFHELTESLKVYSLGVEENTRKLLENKKAIEDRNKATAIELKNLKATNINNNISTAIGGAVAGGDFENAKQLNAKRLELEKQAIDERFTYETKGLEKSSTQYQLAVEKREQADNESLNKYQATLVQIGQEQVNLTTQYLQGANTIIQEAFNFFSVLNKKAQEDLQENADSLNAQLTGVQEQISFLDSVINDKKSRIRELENQAADSIGGERQAILDQLDAEAEKTAELVKEKKAQEREEKSLQKQLNENAKQNAKLQKEQIQLQKQAAAAASVLALAQASVAVTKAFEPDLASSSTPYGIGLAIRAAAAIAFAATLFSTISSITDLLADGGYVQKKAEGGSIDPYGYTNTLGIKSKPDSTGERPTKQLVQLHQNEWVAPRWMVESSKYGSMVNELEKARVRGYADGGTIGNTDISRPDNQNDLLTKLLVSNLNKPVFVAVTDINEGQNRVSVIDNRTKL